MHARRSRIRLLDLVEPMTDLLDRRKESGKIGLTILSVSTFHGFQKVPTGYPNRSPCVKHRVCMFAR